MRLAKPWLDVGLFTNQRDAQLSFWGQTANLSFERMVKLGSGMQQHRFVAHSSIIKINHARAALREHEATGYQGLVVALPAFQQRRQLLDPDGNVLVTVPPDERDGAGIAVCLIVSSRARHERFLTRVLNAEKETNERYRIGRSAVLLEEHRSARSPPSWKGRGYRYITLQIHDVDMEHRAALEHGATNGAAPCTIGTTARISFIRDPDGNWIELSQ